MLIVLVIVTLVSLSTIFFYMYLNSPEGYIDTTLYYTDNETYFLVKENRMIKKTDNKRELIESIFREIKKPPKKASLSSPWPANININSFDLPGNGELIVSFAESYNDLDAIQEVLLRSSLAKTILDTPECGISNVYFEVGTKPVIVGNDKEMTAFNNKNIVLCPKIEPVGTTNKKVKLYFIDSEAKKLVPIERDIEVKGVKQDGRCVIEELMKGPIEDPENLSKVFTVNVGIKDFSKPANQNTCYVEFDQEFNTMFSSDPEIARLQLYAIINSLTALPETKLVKIFVNNNGKVGTPEIVGDFNFDEPFEENKALIME